MTSVNPTANVGTTTREAVDAHGHQEMHEQLLSPLAKNANVRVAINEILRIHSRRILAFHLVCTIILLPRIRRQRGAIVPRTGRGSG